MWISHGEIAGVCGKLRDKTFVKHSSPKIINYEFKEDKLQLYFIYLKVHSAELTALSHKRYRRPLEILGRHMAYSLETA